jgi:hypothetical protein
MRLYEGGMAIQAFAGGIRRSRPMPSTEAVIVIIARGINDFLLDNPDLSWYKGARWTIRIDG